MRLYFTIAACCSLLAGCVGQTLLTGYPQRPAPVPGDSVRCGEVRGHDWIQTVRIAPSYPEELMMFEFARETGSRGSLNSIDLRYDITPEGMAANIRHVGPQWQRDHGSVARAVQAAADAVENWRWEWTGDGAPRFAQECLVQFNFQNPGW